MKITDEAAMQLAIDEALKGGPYVSPNPLVGSVVTSAEGHVLASGYHEIFGGPHAEVNALKGLSIEQLRGATVYVTLEPCAHEGKTPSCARMLAKLPLKKVVYGLIDPNPLVAGQGAQILKDAGIETELFCDTHPTFKGQLEEVCEKFLWNFRNQSVFVSLKVAQSLDGQIALKTGESKWITNELSREYTHYIRACHDAVLVGRGTVQADNPSLDIRHPRIKKENKVIVLDPSGVLLDESSQMKITRSHATEDIYWCVGKKRGADALSTFAKVLFIKENPDGTLDLQDLMNVLWSEGLRSIMVEGGATTASAFLSANLVNRLYIFQAPILLGSGGSRSWTEGLSLTEMKSQIRLRNLKHLQFGEDSLFTGLIRP